MYIRRMNCDYCQSPATIFLSQVSGKNLKKIALCEECSQNPEVIKKEGLEHVLNLPPIPEPSPPAADTPKTARLTCSCGFTLDEINTTGRLGCAECYHVFAGVLSERITNMHRGSTHVGKTITTTLSRAALEQQRDKIESALQTAITDELFEQAAQLRDDLLLINQQISEL